MNSDTFNLKEEFIEYELGNIDITDIESMTENNLLEGFETEPDFLLNTEVEEKKEETNFVPTYFGNNNIPFSQQQYFQPVLLNYPLFDAQSQFSYISQYKGIQPQESFQIWNNNIVPQFSNIQQKKIEYIRLIEGFNSSLRGKKQPGGKDNSKHYLPIQKVEYFPIKGLEPNSMICKASVCGYDKVKRDKIILGELGEKKFIEENKRFIATFDNLIIKFSSHLNGQKLSLRFSLLDSNRNCISFVDSFEFETITKRGKEKQVEREKRKRVDSLEDSLVSYVTPSLGPATGGQLVKIYGQNFICPPMNQTIIKFGDRLVREIHSIKRNCIICETPSSEPGTVQVSVSFDKKTFLPTEATYQYVNPNTQEGVSVLLQNLFKE